MRRFHEILLLAAITGLMFCIIPINGMELRLSWQLASIWLGGAAFAAFLSSWWWRGFFLLALVRTATIIPPSYDSYIGLLMIAIFLAAAEGFSRIDKDLTMNALCVAAIALLLWIGTQEMGLTRVWFPGRTAGPFNPDSAGIFLALCLPASLRRKWWYLAPFILAGIVIAHSSTAMIAAAAAGGAFILRQGWGKKVIAVTALAIALGISVWFWQVKSFDHLIENPRWVAWRYAALSMPAQPLGYGIGSWENIFPLLASGDKRLGDVTNSGNELIMSNVFCQAHNEYVQTAFELGGQTLLLIIGFLGVAGWVILFRPVSAPAAAGMAALAVACFGWHLFHDPPVALLGVAWLGIWKREARLSPIALHFSLRKLEFNLTGSILVDH